MKHRLGVGTVVALSLVLSSISFSVAAPSQCSNVIKRGQRWETVVVDGFPASSGDRLPNSELISVFGVSPSDGRMLFVGSGEKVMRSKDAGCTWNLAYELPQVPDPGSPFLSKGTAELEQIAVARSDPEKPDAAPAVYLVFWGSCPDVPDPMGNPKACPAGGSSRVVDVLASRDGGDSWQAWERPTAKYVRMSKPLNGDMALLRVSPTDPNTVYFVMEETIFPGVLRTLYVSHDGARSWTQQSVRPASHDVRWAIDPLNDSVLWEWEEKESETPDQYASGFYGGIRFSQDSGQTWTQVDTGGLGGVDALAISHREGEEAALVGARDSVGVAEQRGQIIASDDGGKSWAMLADQVLSLDNLLFGKKTVVGLGEPLYLSTSNDYGLYRFDPRMQSWQPLSPNYLTSSSVVMSPSVIPLRRPLLYVIRQGDGRNGGSTYGSSLERFNGRI